MARVSLFACEPCNAVASRSPDELVAEFVALYTSRSNRRQHYAARHLLCWLRLHKIAMNDVDNAVLERFGKHRCRCPGYRTTPDKVPGYMAVVRMFVHLLEQRGVKPSGQQAEISVHLEPYIDAQKAKKYNVKVAARMAFDARHFVYWVGGNVDWLHMDRDVIDRFVQHDCSCPRASGGRAKHSNGAVLRRNAAKFLAYLVEQGVVALPPDESKLDERLAAYCHWLATTRARSPAGVEETIKEVKRWYCRICGEGMTCSTDALRSILLDQAPQRSRGSIDRTVSTLRSFVRFLISRGECPADRLAALVVTPRRTAQQVPRHIDREMVEQIIAACNISTPVGIRDRALILLLARLGLRAGDIVAMQLDDIDWDRGTVRVSGKSARQVLLPLPQDAGEAILDYIERVRPMVADKHLFLRVRAPYRSFARSSIIPWIVSQAVERAGLTGIPSGSHVFRHSLATTMLREGATLEAIGTVLRHVKPDTTAIYAKVDFNMLAEVAQPWMGGASC